MKKIQVDKYVTASFDVDAQKGFTPLCPNELPVPEGHLISQELNGQAQFVNVRVGSKDWHPSNALWIANEFHPQFTPICGYPNLDMYWNAHCIAGTEGAELLPMLPSTEEYEFMVYKGLEANMHPYGACYHDLGNRKSTGVIEFLKSRDISVVIVGGLATDYCVKTTCIQLIHAEFDLIINLGGCRGINPDTTTDALASINTQAWLYRTKLDFINSYEELERC